MVKKIICLLLLVIGIALFSTKADAAVGFKNLVGKYEFDVERYIEVNESGPSIDFGSEFSSFKPYLEITSKKKVEYYYGFEGGKGKCSLKGKILKVVLNRSSWGDKIKEKMKVKKIGNRLYLVQSDSNSGKKIYWRKM